MKLKGVFQFLKSHPIDPVKLTYLEVADASLKDLHLMVVGRWAIDSLNLSNSFDSIKLKLFHRISFHKREVALFFINVHITY